MLDKKDRRELLDIIFDHARSGLPSAWLAAKYLMDRNDRMRKEARAESKGSQGEFEFLDGSGKKIFN